MQNTRRIDRDVGRLPGQRLRTFGEARGRQEQSLAIMRERQLVLEAKKMPGGKGNSSWRKRAVVAAVTVAITASLVACSEASANPAATSQAGDWAKVTGYKVSSAAGVLSGSVSVILRGSSAVHLAQIAAGLPTAGAIGCVDDALQYRITVHDVTGSPRDFNVAGWACDGRVQITTDGKTATRRDSDCALLTVVRRALPQTAISTQHDTAGCK